MGDKLKFNMTYNTDATFDFDSKNLKLKYDGKEDEIIKSIEAGNVSMTTGSSLIKGSTALFGLKTKMQFGKFSITALVSQQNSESQTVSTKGGAQTTKFSINADDYDKTDISSSDTISATHTTTMPRSCLMCFLVSISHVLRCG